MSATPKLKGLEAAQSLRALMADQAQEAEVARTMTAPVVEALWESGLMRWCNPTEAGGSEPSFSEMIETWIELAWQDGSLGWVGIANFPSAAAASAYLPAEGFNEVFPSADHKSTVGGQFFPNGMGEEVEGGYLVTGSWNFGSGTGHASHVAAGFMPSRGGEMIFGDDGMPPLLVAIVPREEVEFTDGWHVQGLRGTGSYDYKLSECFVPLSRTFPLLTRAPERGNGAVFAMGLMPITAAGHGAWALGVAKSALDDVEELAKTKVRMGDESSLANRATFQRDLSHQVASWKAARLLLLETFSTVEAAVARGEDLSPSMRADMRVAASFATEISREAVHFAHLAAGTTAIRQGSRIERAFRDMYTGTQHVFIGERTYIDAAKIRLGLIEDQFGF